MGKSVNDIKNSILNVLAITFITLLFVFAFTWIIFDFQGSASSLKDTWSIVGSVFGGTTTLAAAYIASLLFNDWRDAHNKNVLALCSFEHHKTLTDLNVALVALNDSASASLRNHQLSGNTQAFQFALDTKSDITIIANLLIKLIHQNRLLSTLIKADCDELSLMNNLILDYISIMDEGYISRLSNLHRDFINKEAYLKHKLEKLMPMYNEILSSFMTTKHLSL